MSNDKERKAKWARENCVRYYLIFTLKSGIPAALQNMQNQTGESPLRYIRRIVIESLQFDGYLQEDIRHPRDD